MSYITAWEKFISEHPEMFIFDPYDLEVGCPYIYEYLQKDQNICDAVDCEKCWNREIPEEKEKETMIEATGYASVAAAEIDYEAAYERVGRELEERNKFIEEQNSEIQKLNHDLELANETIDTYREIIEKQQQKIDKYELVIRAFEAFCGQKILEECSE